MERIERKLSAILAADVAGYSRLMGLDEEGTLSRLTEYRRHVVDPGVVRNRGRMPPVTGTCPSPRGLRGRAQGMNTFLPAAVQPGDGRVSGPLGKRRQERTE